MIVVVVVVLLCSVPQFNQSNTVVMIMISISEWIRWCTMHNCCFSFITNQR